MSTDTLTLLPAPLNAHIQALNLVPLTQVQQLSLPKLLAGGDLRIQAPTGSGKTVAFGLGLLAKLDLSRRQPQGLVLAPSRELAEQIAQVLRQLGRPYPNLHVAAVYGGTDQSAQEAALRHGAHLIVATPGRLTALLKQGALTLDQVRILVLDEADRLHAEGFVRDLQTLTAALPRACQRVWCSATYPEALLAMAPADAIEVQGDTPDIHQQALCLAPSAQLAEVIPQLTGQGRTLVFVNTKAVCRTLAQQLCKARCPALALHGDLNQQQREQTLIRFRHGSAPLLIATDLAARGLDVEAIETVINAELASDSDTHSQRIGRTARAGASGRAITLYRPEQQSALQQLAPGIPSQPAPSQSVTVTPNSLATLMVDAGRRARLRKGDLMGALIKGAGVPHKAIAAIDLLNDHSYVTLQKTQVSAALTALNNGQIKGRTVRVKLLL
ncbi:DEAD/DEAH box helicase [Ferrimonas balearica]|uniref:DEAD/DEAH box helicase n=1 Tax=Ferrimonas balearica TaxID=44012 RepID=UPI001C996824|nr:DEAD/DEAH box helicase [Ferrimonas balearica]MBY5920559.1 DEAD/DEAH box helicase [Ferrimonas balearica]MBY5996756.1 DEAD/DEAH box helicase [Ferrimonas balearica]